MKYIGFYSNELIKNMKLDVPLAARAKMSYIAEIIGDELGSCEIISSAPTGWKKGWFCRKRVSISKTITLEAMATFGCRNPILKKVQIIFSQLELLIYLLKNTKKNEDVLVYHSLYLMLPIYLAVKLKKFNLILEMEELYSDVWEKQGLMRKLELRYCKLGKIFLFPTVSLKKTIGLRNVPCAIVHGTYQIPQKQTRLFCDGKIHLVYAGTLDPRKGGMLAVRMADYLPPEYHIHILGFGTEKEKEALNRQILKRRYYKTDMKRAFVSYDGIKTGSAYTAFLQSCHIGLCTQEPTAAFSDTSFPSKILSYIGNGLRVVSIRIPAVEQSGVGDIIYFYDKPDEREIADTILNIDFEKEYDGSRRIQKLDEAFRKDMRNLFGREKTGGK